MGVLLVISHKDKYKMMGMCVSDKNISLYNGFVLAWSLEELVQG